MSRSHSPTLSDLEWSRLEAFLGIEVGDREATACAFWENTFAHDHLLDADFERPAWLGDRVLNLALADRIESAANRARGWNGTADLLRCQENAVAAEVARRWPDEIRGLLRLGNTWTGRRVPDIVLATFAEALVGLVFRERGYEVARAFVWEHWHG